MEEDLEKQITQKIVAAPPGDKLKLIALKYHLDQIKEQDKEIEKQSDEIQAKYDLLNLPQYQESAAIVNGTQINITDEQRDIAKRVFNEEDLKAYLEIEKLDGKPIEKYWLTVLKNSQLSELDVQEHDEPLLTFLENIELKWEQNMTDFTLVFSFSDNPHFKNKQLLKKFFHKEKELIKTEGTKIEWNDGKNVTKKLTKKKQKNKKTGQTRVISKEVDQESFFLFFRTLNTDNIEKLPEEEQEEIQEQLEIDHETGRQIIDEILPYQVEYYLNLRNDGEEIEEVDKQQTRADDSDDFSDEDKPITKAKKPAKK
ncbi:hypothetical protein pb186bvf_013052 [Paramecium bursaria]